MQDSGQKQEEVKDESLIALAGDNQGAIHDVSSAEAPEKVEATKKTQQNLASFESIISNPNSKDDRKVGSISNVTVARPGAVAVAVRSEGSNKNTATKTAAGVADPLTTTPPSFLQDIQPLPSANNPSPAAQSHDTSLPGAYAEVPGWRQDSVNVQDILGVENSVDRNLEDAVACSPQPLENSGAGESAVSMSDVQAMNYHQGLVHAREVENPANRQVAVQVVDPPKDSDTAVDNTNDKQNQKWWVLLSLVLVVLAAVGLTVGLAATKNKHADDPIDKDSAATSTTIPDQNSTTILPKPDVYNDVFFMPILHRVPNSTLDFIQNHDTTSPQYQAYQWLRQDAAVNNHTEDRLLQRFVLAIFYYATMGPTHWKYKGGGSVVINTNFRPMPTPGFLLTSEPGNQSGTSNYSTNTTISQPSTNNSFGGRWLYEESTAISTTDSEEWDSMPRSTFLRRKLQQQPEPTSGLFRQIYINGTQPWLSHEYHECIWFSKTPVKEQETCFDDGNYKNLALSFNSLAGTLPQEISLITSLESISVGKNKIRGTIPSNIGLMPNLIEFRVFGNLMTGTVPSELGLLSNSLRQLSFLDNDFSGELPTEFWNLSNLTDLLIGNNANLRGTLPADFGERFPKLRLFLSEGAQFAGTIPTSIGKCSDLVELVINNNQLSRELPSELGKLSRSLILLKASSNPQLAGQLPSELGLLTSLQELRLDGNPKLSGTIPLALIDLAVHASLTKLSIRGTSISGSIPPEACLVVSFSCSTDNPLLCGCDCPCA